ncbi:hypothetical protein CMA01_23260 [Carnobacterium maltaromaticum]|nr:hypothetical protein CMA01_23260 [Carnobacterium maltaromaticum]
MKLKHYKLLTAINTSEPLLNIHIPTAIYFRYTYVIMINIIEQLIFHMNNPNNKNTSINLKNLLLLNLTSFV